MGSCFPFLSGEDNAQELDLLFPMDFHRHTQRGTHIPIFIGTCGRTKSA